MGTFVIVAIALCASSLCPATWTVYPVEFLIA